MKKVLIVDDAAFMRITLKTMLEKNEFEVIGEAPNGLEGVKKYAELKPDVVTMDITMQCGWRRKSQSDVSVVCR